MSTKNSLWKILEQLSAALPYLPPKKENENLIIHSALTLNYAGQNLSKEILQILCELAIVCKLPKKIEDLVSGKIVNQSEEKPALHTALRANPDSKIFVNQKNIIPEIYSTLNDIKKIVEKIQNKKWLGYTGKPIKNIVHIGIGGSDFGPRFCIHALKNFITSDLGFHFIYDSDPNRFEKTIDSLTPETTLFIVASKSFTTLETIFNVKKAIEWIGPSSISTHFIAITENYEKAKQWGITKILPIWSWIGGRYSFCSAVNLISTIALGIENFQEILNGARSMDEHFLHEPFESNLPVLLGLISIWNNNFLNITNLLILTYAQELEHFVPFVQQLEMESNGKSIDNDGNKVDYHTAPIVWGGPGNQAEHSYYQLLCQGTHKIAADLITFKDYTDEIINSSCEAKKKVFMNGCKKGCKPNAQIDGSIPFNHITLNACSPYTIGALVALYEHKVFVESVIWNINPFDQPGVESAKKFKL